MSAAPHSPAVARLRAVHAVEIVVWALCAGLTLLIAAYTISTPFPAQVRALLGEAIVLGAALFLTLLALGRWHRAGDPTQPEPGRHAFAIAAAFAALRVLLGVPALAFALVAAASGFAA